MRVPKGWKLLITNSRGVVVEALAIPKLNPYNDYLNKGLGMLIQYKLRKAVCRKKPLVSLKPL